MKKIEYRLERWDKTVIFQALSIDKKYECTKKIFSNNGIDIVTPRTLVTLVMS